MARGGGGWRRVAEGGWLDLTPLRGLQISPAHSKGQAAQAAA